MKIQEPTKIELSDQNSGVISLKKNAPNNSRVSLHGKMKEAKPVALVLKIPDLCGVVNNTVLTDGNEILFGSSSETPELSLLNLNSFTCRQFNSKELESAQWPDTRRIRIRDGAIHSGLIILSMDKYEYELQRMVTLKIYDMDEARLASYHGVPHLCSFSVKEDLKPITSPTLPEGFFIHSISIDEKYIYMGGHSSDTDFPWEIRIWERETLRELPKLIGPTLSKDLEVPDEWIQHVVTQKNLIVAVTPLGRLFYWDNFTALPDRSVTLTDDLMYSERYIDTVYLNEDLDRVVMMHLMSGADAAMVLDKKLSLVPAYALTQEDTGNAMDYYLRIDTECQTVVRVMRPIHEKQLDTPQLDIYPLSESEPWFSVQPLSVSLNVDLGVFVDVWVGKDSLTYFGAKGAVQLRFDQQHKMDSNYETTTSSLYMAFRY